jgi:hypothetical protein
MLQVKAWSQPGMVAYPVNETSSTVSKPEPVFCPNASIVSPLVLMGAQRGHGLPRSPGEQWPDCEPRSADLRAGPSLRTSAPPGAVCVVGQALKPHTYRRPVIVPLLPPPFLSAVLGWNPEPPPRQALYC